MTASVRYLVLLLVLLVVHAQPNENGGNGGEKGGGGGNGGGGGGGGGGPPNKGQQQSGMGDKPQRPPPGRKPPVDKRGGKAEKRFQLSSGGFNIEANGNGNVPFYRYWADGGEANKVKIMFMRLFQTSNPDDPAGSAKLRRVNLVGGYSWNFTDATEYNTTSNTTEVAFNITSILKQGGGGPDAAKPDITFVNRLIANENGTELKFDVHITNFLSEWWDASATHLVTGYRVVNEDNSGGERNISLADVRVQRNAERPVRPCPEDQLDCDREAATAVEFGNGNGIEAVATADGGSGTANIDVTVTVGQDGGEEGDGGEDGSGSFLYISYAKFDGSLHHDPTAYNQETSSSSISVATAQTIYDEDGNAIFKDGVAVDPATGDEGDLSAASGLTPGAALRMGVALAAMALALVL